MKHNLTNLLINIYFALSEALDMLLREIEYRIKVVEGGELKHEVKQAHRLMMRAAEDFHRRYDLYLDRVKIDCLPNKANYDLCREDANEFLRLLISYADRCTTPEAVADVMEAIKKNPERVAPEEYVNKFTLK